MCLSGLKSRRKKLDSSKSMPVRKIKGSWWIDFSYDHVRYRKKSMVNTKMAAQYQEIHMREELAKIEFRSNLGTVARRY